MYEALLFNLLEKIKVVDGNINLEASKGAVNDFQKELQKNLEEDFRIKQGELQILHSFEKQNLDLLKEYKEEIKFLYSSQEELRKERANFFATTLKEIIATLRNEEVDSKIASVWLNALVESYTKSLDLSEKFAQEGITNLMEDLRKKRKEIVNSKIPNENLKNEKK